MSFLIGVCVSIFGFCLLLCLFSPPFGLVWAFVPCFDVSLVLIVMGSFMFRCGSRRSVVLCDVVYPLLSGLAEGRVVACLVARDR